LLGFLGLFQLGGGILGAVDRVLADLLDDVAGAQALVFSRAALLDRGDQRALDAVLDAQLLARLGGDRRQREAERTRRDLAVLALVVVLVGLGLLVHVGVVAELGAHRHVLAVAHQAELDRAARR